jgi:hypothetical protein
MQQKIVALIFSISRKMSFEIVQKNEKRRYQRKNK